RPLRRDHRSATDYRSVSYLDHVPVSPFAMIEAGARGLASCIALAGTLMEKIGKTRLRGDAIRAVMLTPRLAC
ncbi:MAG: hypothetical protein Q7U13_14815, partial [Rhodoferax sp.]|nr:hypothetical protein [Rhodoferax sp.]